MSYPLSKPTEFFESVIDHHIASESAIWKGMTIMVAVCCVFTLIVAGMNYGRYGYLPSLDFFWAPFVMLFLWMTHVRLSRIRNEKWKYQITIFGYPITTQYFDRIDWEQNGKIFSILGSCNGVVRKTAIFVEASSEHKKWIDYVIQMNEKR